MLPQPSKKVGKKACWPLPTSPFEKWPCYMNAADFCSLMLYRLLSISTVSFKPWV